MSNEVIAQALREFGQAIRGDWSSSSIDGRCIQSQMQIVAEVLEGKNAFYIDAISYWRDIFGICPDGGGHWAGSYYGYCETDDGCPSLRKS